MKSSQKHHLGAKKCVFEYYPFFAFFATPLCVIISGQMILMSMMLFGVGSNVYDHVGTIPTKECSRRLEDANDIVTHICNIHNTNFNSLIGSLPLKPITNSCLCVFLCHLLPLHSVRPFWRSMCNCLRTNLSMNIMTVLEFCMFSSQMTKEMKKEVTQSVYKS